MSVNSIYFSRNGVSLKDLVEFLGNDFEVDASRIQDSNLGGISSTSGFLFLKKKKKFVFNIFYFSYGYVASPLKENVPVETIPGESFSLLGETSTKYIKLFEKIAKYFGGYVCQDDCNVEEEDSDLWKAYVGTFSKEDNSIDEKIFGILTEYASKNEGFAFPHNSGKSMYLIKFVKDNLDKIKKL